MKRLLLFFLPAVLLLAACSTTKAIPEGEQLYTGIDEITYTERPTASTKKQADSTGVITAVADAVTTVSDVLQGKTTAESLLSASKPLDEKTQKKEEKRLAKQMEEDFATAKEEVEAVLAYPPNNAIFGSSSMSWPWKVGLWVHNGFANSKGKFGKWMLKHFGTSPVLVSQVSPEMRVKVATNTLHNYGFFRGKVTYDILTQKNPKKARIAYHVRAGKVYRLDSIAYLNYPSAMDSILRAHSAARLLKSGEAFSVVNLSDEQTRIEKLMKENGYYFYKAAYTTFRADTIMRPGFVQLQVQPIASRPKEADRPWYIGKVHVHLRRNENDVTDKTLRRRRYTYSFSGDKMPLRASVWRHAIAHRSGEKYRLSDYQTTMEKIGAMGVLSQMDLSYVPRDTSALAGDTLDLVIHAVMDKLFDSTFEMNATFKSNQQVGPGVSYELSKRNAFRGGEKVSFKIFGSYEWQTGAGAEGGNSLLNSYELGTALTFRFPRFVFPGVSRRRQRFPATTDFVIDADWKNRSGFFQMVSMGLEATYGWHKRATRQHKLTLFSLDFDRLLTTTSNFEKIMAENPALYVSMRNQFIPAMSYTYTYQSPSTRRDAWWMQFHVKEAGHVTSLIYAAAGKSLSQRDKELFGNPFAQFVKFTAEHRRTFRLNQSLSLASRVFAGVVCSYGNSQAAPYAEQFYVGGANSIRAFTVRSIGPGSYKPSSSRYSYMDQTGDVRLEANVELRARLIGDLCGAVFLDAGNVWLLRPDANRPGAQLTASSLRHIALGTGAGIRYDLDFIVLRFDVGIGLHMPYQTEKSGFYNIPRFKDGIGLHFAIGYPF